MSTVRIRRAVVLGSVLALVVASAAVADTLTPDGDSLNDGPQNDLSFNVAPDGSVGVDVSFVLTCRNSSHLPAGATVAIVAIPSHVPAGGSLTSVAGELDVPQGWAAGGDCGDPAMTAASHKSAHLVFTAPSTPGPWDPFDVEFSVDPYVVSNSVFLTVTLNAGPGGEPEDTTPPVLSSVPSDMTVFTSGTTATVTWTGPTATDDTDPSPVVGCDPASGSSFALGTTGVTCTATDASGNASQATFAVTVRQLAGTWGQPLDDGKLPALVGQLGRTVPLKLTVTAGGASQGAGAIDVPELLLERLDSCSGGSVQDTRQGGSFSWSDGTWMLGLRTDDLSTGCWRLVATVDGSALANAVIVLTSDATAAGNTGGADSRPRR